MKSGERRPNREMPDQIAGLSPARRIQYTEAGGRLKNLDWSIIENADTPEAVAIHQALRDHVAGQVGPSGRKDLTIALKGLSGDLVAGLRGFSHWTWFYVSHLWVSEAGRSSGLGGKLMAKAESYATDNGLVGLYVDTFDPRACEFYKRCGFSLMGEIPNFPPGHTRFYLTKALSK